MPRSPLSPVGKRMRTMNSTSDDNYDPDSVVQDQDQTHLDLSEDSHESHYSRNDCSDDDDDHHSGPHNNSGNEIPDDIDAFDDIVEASEDSSTTTDDDDDDDEDDDEEDNLDEDEENVDLDAEESSSYSRDSLSSEYYPVLFVDDIPRAYAHEHVDELELILSDYDSEAEEEIDPYLPDDYLKYDPTPETQYPKPEWITVHELRQRSLGFPSTKRITRPNMCWFEKYVNNSLWMIQRLKKTKQLEDHTGHVNCVDFNSDGNLLCSGSDDLAICIWDWQRDKLKKKANSGHLNNVIHSQFCNSDNNIITTSRDGTVRLLNIETGLSELLLSESGEIGNLAFITPQTLVTCGTNACVNFIDLRTKDPTRLFIVRNPKNNRTCGLHSINAHPLDKHKIVVAGASPYVLLYDLRRVASNPDDVDHKPTYCIDKVENLYTIVTSTAFNSRGDKLLISYNDDDLYVCKTDTYEIVHRYKGHRNRKTIKECCWFGENYVMSGSDDGHIYGWDFESEHIVCFLKGDDRGIVNTLSVHPSLPVLASSGLDHNVKVWEPISDTWPQTLKGIKPQICKNTRRRNRTLERHNHIFRLIDGESDTDL